MKNVILIAVIIVVIVIGALVTKKSNIDSIQQTDGSTVEVEKTIIENSRYIEYSKSILESSKSTRRVLFFYANWCPTCRPTDASFSQNESKIPPDVTLIRVNYDDTETNQEERNLATRYGVTYQHTFVQIDENDDIVTIWNGGQVNELLQNIK